MKISYVNSVCARNDAISNAILDEFGFLKRSGHEDIRLFAFQCDHREIPFTPCQSIADIANHPHFLESDIVVFHFGIYYSLFNLFPIVPKRARRVVVFHNITPRDLVPEKDRWLIDKSVAQLDNIRWADHVICDSDTNLGVLRSQGLTTSASVVPLAVHSEISVPEKKPSFSDGTVRIVFVGRFTRSKAPHELLAAIDQLASTRELNAPVQLDLIGNLAFSSPDMIAVMERMISDIHQRHGTDLSIRIHGSASDETKHRLLSEADIFALPTYHEGFCVPIIEAIASGCRVVVYDNSNTSDVAGSFGTMVRTGDVGEFAQALRLVMSQVGSTDWREGRGQRSYTQYAAAGKQYARRFSPDHIGPIFLRTLSGIMAP
ncbi:glycosyltransferase family 4 protein [Variovorax paradoxus]|jgi:glycosyltransferase involved in cell wall biosynthesis|uniref:glycosyltransferase family 4 protein n=1 Tax=Variovorax paradoxus TaxID=34073 RepID=UPI000409786E